MTSTDDMTMERPVLKFADVDVGRIFPTSRLQIAAKTIHALEQCLALPRDQFPQGVVQTDEAGRLIVPLFLLNELFSLKRYIRIPTGTMHAQEHIEVSGPAFADEDLQVDIRIADKYIKGSRRYVTVEQVLSRAGEWQPIMKIVRLFAWAE